VKFLCEQCKAKYQIADEKAAGKTVRMKCRKCGHLIEVRATVGDAGSDVPVEAEAPAQRASAPPGRPSAPPKPAQKPAPPRAGPLATSLASAKPPAKTGDRVSSALGNAFRSSVQREEESSAPFDMSDLSPGDEWYVAINGVPVGPIRIADVRRKAALGAVTEESLCWQEGLDEWRPVRSFPELATIVREALASGRSSLPPTQGEGRSSLVPQPRPAPSASPTRPSQPPAASPRPPARPAPSAATASRSNVVPITSRLATAEKLEEAPDDRTKPFTGVPPAPAVEADPFAHPPPALGPVSPPGATQHIIAMSDTAAASIAAPAVVQPRKAPPWMAIAMVAAACAFGVTAALAVFLRPPPAPTPVVVQVPGPAAPAPTQAPTGSPTAAATDTTSPEPTATTTAARGPIAMNNAGRPAPSAAPTAAAKGPLDLGGLGGSVKPTDDPGGDAPKAPGQCFSSGQVSQVIGLHQPGIRRSCWERNPTTKPAVNVTVNLTIGADGTPGAVAASADEGSVAKCVENDVRSWRFPAMGCSQPTSFSLHFVRQ
jgi:predicted Zn finger-like uncharacterized protein